MIFRKTKKAMTLIELLLYSTMLSLFIVVASVFVWDISAGKIKTDSQAEVTDNAEIAMNEISRSVRNAKSIVAPATKGVPAPSLTLAMPDEGQIIFDLTDGRLRMTNTRAQRVNIDVILVIDVSGSMAGQPLTSEKTAANSFIDHMDAAFDTIGIVSFSSTATLRQPLTSNFASAKSVVNGLGASGMTNYQDAIQKSTLELTGANHRADASTVMIFMSDGVPNVCNGWGCNPTNSAKAAADNAKAQGITNYSIGLMQAIPSYQLPSARSILQYIASSNPNTVDHYFEAPTDAELTNIYNQIAFLLTSTGSQNITSSIVSSELNQLSFTNVGDSGSPGSVRVQMQILRKNTSGRSEYNSSISIDSIISLRANQ